MATIQLTVTEIQRAAKVAHRRGDAVPDPGPITGTWNSRTADAWDAITGGEFQTRVLELNGTPSLVEVGGAQAGELANFVRLEAGRYEPLQEEPPDPNGGGGGRGGGGRGGRGGGGGPIIVDEGGGGLVVPMSTGKKVAIGFGVAAVVTGIGIWIWRSR